MHGYQWSRSFEYLHSDFGEGQPGQVRETFTSAVPIRSTTAADIKDVLVSELAKVGLDTKNIAAASFDGGSNFSGARKGVQALLKEYALDLLFVHCRAHLLQLAVLNACKLSREVKAVISSLNQHFTLFSKSHKRLAVVKVSPTLNILSGYMIPSAVSDSLKCVCVCVLVLFPRRFIQAVGATRSVELATCASDTFTSDNCLSDNSALDYSDSRSNNLADYPYHRGEPERRRYRERSWIMPNTKKTAKKASTVKGPAKMAPRKPFPPRRCRLCDCTTWYR